MNIPSLPQFNAFAERVVVAASGAITYASLFHLFQNTADAQVATDAVHHIGAGFKEIAGGVAALVPIAFGVAAAFKANPIVQFAMSAAAMLHSRADTSKVSADDQKKIMEATLTLPKVVSLATNDRLIAATTPSEITFNAVTSK